MPSHVPFIYRRTIRPFHSPSTLEIHPNTPPPQLVLIPLTTPIEINNPSATPDKDLIAGNKKPHKTDIRPFLEPLTTILEREEGARRVHDNKQSQRNNKRRRKLGRNPDRIPKNQKHYTERTAYIKSQQTQAQEASNINQNQMEFTDRLYYESTQRACIDALPNDAITWTHCRIIKNELLYEETIESCMSDISRWQFSTCVKKVCTSKQETEGRLSKDCTEALSKPTPPDVPLWNYRDAFPKSHKEELNKMGKGV